MAAQRAWDTSLLQWGRGLKTPEIGMLPSPEDFSKMLQWGRGLKTPEMRSRVAAARRRRSASMGPGS